MDIVGMIKAVFEFLTKLMGFLGYWLNPTERARRRKAEYLLQVKELQGQRDLLFKKGATDGFSPDIDYAMAQVEKQIKDLLQKAELLGVN